MPSWPTLDEPFAQPEELGGWLAKIELAVGHLSKAISESGQRPRIPWEAAHPVWFTGSIPLTAGAGTLQQKDLYGPKTAHWWDVRSIQLRGFTAATAVQVFRNSAVAGAGEIVAQTTTIGEFTWSNQRLLSPEDQLIFVASGITGSVFVTGVAIEVATEWLPEYLM